jgi:hypothetical protein
MSVRVATRSVSDCERAVHRRVRHVLDGYSTTVVRHEGLRTLLEGVAAFNEVAVAKIEVHHRALFLIKTVQGRNHRLFPERLCD